MSAQKAPGSGLPTHLAKKFFDPTLYEVDLDLPFIQKPRQSPWTENVGCSVIDDCIYDRRHAAHWGRATSLEGLALSPKDSGQPTDGKCCAKERGQLAKKFPPPRGSIKIMIINSCLGCFLFLLFIALCGSSSRWSGRKTSIWSTVVQ